MSPGDTTKQAGSKFFSFKAPLLRILIVALAAYLMFSQVLIPLRIRGDSMAPTYRDGGFTFCFRLRYLLTPPERQDVVTVRFTGRKMMLLKRVVAFAGESVSFVDGVLFINGQPLAEPYLKFPANWNLPPRVVEKNHVYVIGDNRRVPMDTHDFGQTPLARIIGAPLW